MAHEMAHTIQQSDGRFAGVIQRNPDNSEDDVRLSFSERYHGLASVLSRDEFRALEDSAVIRAFSRRIREAGETDAADLIAHRQHLRETARRTVTIVLEDVLDEASHFVDEDVWDRVFTLFASSHDYAYPGELIRNEIRRRWFSENQLCGDETIEILLRDPAGHMGGDATLDFLFAGLVVEDTNGLLDIVSLDHALDQVRLDTVAEEVLWEATDVAVVADLAIGKKRSANYQQGYEKISRDST